MPSITVEVEFLGVNREIEIDLDDVSVYSGLLEDTVLSRLSDDSEVEIPESLNSLDFWKVTYVENLPDLLIGKGNVRRLQDIEKAFEANQVLKPDEFEVYVRWCDESNHVFSADEYKERYLGSFDMEGDYAAELLNDLIDLRKPEYDMVRNYIDYEGMERDMALSGDIDVIKQGFTRHIFRTY